MSRRQAFSLIELVVVMAIIGLMIAILLPAIGAARQVANQNRAATHLRGLHSGAVIFAQNNNTYLPGLNTGGVVLANGDDTGNSGAGDTAAARWWVLLSGIYIPSDMLQSPVDNTVRWDTGSVSTANFSYALLAIGDQDNDAGRRSEWRDHANSQALLISDRNFHQDLPNGSDDNQVKSLWTTNNGEWVGVVNWGDNHTELIKSNREIITRYQSNVTTNDNLFATASSGGTTDSSYDPTSNAMMIYN